AAVAVEAAAVGHVGETATEEPGFEERLAQAVEEVVDEREAVMSKGALLLDLEPGRQRRVAQLLRLVEADVEGPDPGQRAAADVGAEESLESLVDRVPPEGVVGVGDGEEGEPAGLEHPANLPEGVHVAVHVL